MTREKLLLEYLGQVVRSGARLVSSLYCSADLKRTILQEQAAHIAN